MSQTNLHIHTQHIPYSRQHDETNLEHRNHGDFNCQSGYVMFLRNSLSIQSLPICSRYKCEATFANGCIRKIKNIRRSGR